MNYQEKVKDMLLAGGLNWGSLKEVDEIVKAITKLHNEEMKRCRKDTAADVLSLANDYANKDETMFGSENIRGYHYFNALNKIGEFPGR